MKVFFDNKIFVNQSHGGPTNYFINLSKHLNHYCKSEIFSPMHLNDTLHEFKNLGNVYGYKLPFNQYLIKYNFIKKFLHNTNFVLANKNINRFNYDVLHTTYYENYSYKLNNKNLLKVVTIFDLISEKFSNLYGQNKKFLPKKEILNNCDKIICISQNTKKDLQKIYNVPEKKIEVIYLGYPEKIEDLENKFNFPYIMFVGTRWKYKNFDRFIKAYANNKRINSNFKLLIFGGGKFTKLEIKMFKEYKVNTDNIIHVSGDNKTLFGCYKFASLFVYPTLYEGFGLPILESMIYDFPIACSYTSSLPEVAGDGAIYFNPENIDEMSYKIEKILFSENLKFSVINSGKNQLKKFSWDKCARETIDFYKK